MTIEEIESRKENLPGEVPLVFEPMLPLSPT
jgi:hypothetical protein